MKVMLLLLLSMVAPGCLFGAAPTPAGQAGQFWRVHWYERGLEHGNPAYESRFRVNSPEVVLHPEFGKRIEARENGLMLIRAEEDLSPEGSRHELIYSRLPVDPRILRQGLNRIELLSDTERHGIEILLPGPCLMVRSKAE